MSNKGKMISSISVTNVNCILNRLETAFNSVRREQFYCINKFDLKQTVTITFKEKGYFTVNPESMLTSEPYKRVMPNLIRSGWCTRILRESLRKKAATQAIGNKGKNTLFSIGDMEDDVGAWMDENKRNIFRLSAFSTKYIYQFYCKETEKELKKMKTTKALREELFKVDPEAFQVVMVTSELLKKMYAEESLRPRLMSELQRKEKEYKEVFGTIEDAIGQVHRLMANFGTLPTGAKIPLTDFRRVINTNLASIAAFFAYAIFDEKSFNSALALLYVSLENQDTIPDRNRQLPKGMKPLVKVHQPVPYLFHNALDDEGVDFVTNVIQVLNRFGDFLGRGDEPYLKYSKVYWKGRIQGLMFRTLASDLIEIYAVHGCYPVCREICKTEHPWLMNLLRSHKALRPVPVLMEYIILLIENKKIKVFTSHVYTTKYELVARHTPDNKERQMRDIRYIYRLEGAKNSIGEPISDQWWTLPEVVNVILFGTKNHPANATVTDQTSFVSWVPDLATMEKNKRVSLWIKPKEEKQATQPAAETARAATKEATEAEAAANTGAAATAAEPPKEGDTLATETEGEEKEQEKGQEKVTGATEDVRQPRSAVTLVPASDGRIIVLGGGLPITGVIGSPSTKAANKEKGGGKEHQQQQEGEEDEEDEEDEDEEDEDEEDEDEEDEEDDGDALFHEEELEEKGHSTDKEGVVPSNEQEPEVADAMTAKLHKEPERAVACQEQELDVTVHEKFVKASNMVLQMINMGNGKVHEHYPMILESIKNMSISLSIVTGLQQSLIQHNETLSITNKDNEQCDIENILSEVQNFLCKVKKGKGGTAAIQVDYENEGRPKKDFQNLLEKLSAYMGQGLLPATLDELRKLDESDEDQSIFRIDRRSDPAIGKQQFPTRVIQGNDGSTWEKKCIWIREMDESLEETKPPATKRTEGVRQVQSPTPKTPPSERKKRKSDEQSESPTQDEQTKKARTTPKRNARNKGEWRFTPE
jgi:hypothetical protein